MMIERKWLKDEKIETKKMVPMFVDVTSFRFFRSIPIFGCDIKIFPPCLR